MLLRDVNPVEEDYNDQDLAMAIAASLAENRNQGNEDSPESPQPDDDEE